MALPDQPLEHAVESLFVDVSSPAEKVVSDELQAQDHAHSLVSSQMEILAFAIPHSNFKSGGERPYVSIGGTEQLWDSQVLDLLYAAHFGDPCLVEHELQFAFELHTMFSQSLQILQVHIGLHNESHRVCLFRHWHSYSSNFLRNLLHLCF